jgi:hypothetical protein
MELRSCGLYSGDVQLIEPLRFTDDEWLSFMRAVVEFGLDRSW